MVQQLRVYTALAEGPQVQFLAPILGILQSPVPGEFSVLLQPPGVLHACAQTHTSTCMHKNKDLFLKPLKKLKRKVDQQSLKLTDSKTTVQMASVINMIYRFNVIHNKMLVL